MKKESMRLFGYLLVMIIFTGSCKKEQKRLDNFKEENNAAMMKMMENMDAVVMTEDNDIDFARMMIEHHEGGIEMIDILMKYSKHDDLKNMATMGREKDMASIAKLEQFINSHGPPIKSTDNMQFM